MKNTTMKKANQASARKLILDRHTVRQLSSPELDQIAGGQTTRQFTDLCTTGPTTHI